MSRSPLYVIPRHPYQVDLRDVRDAYAVGGASVLRGVVRDLLWFSVRGRATTPDEVEVMVEWIDVETEDQTADLIAKLTRPKARERTAEATPVEPAEEVSEIALCTQCGSVFDRPRCPGRPRARCFTCSPPR